MFFCEPCRKLRDWPESMSRSGGRCEICENSAVCYDVPSKFLPIPTQRSLDQWLLDDVE